jgi:transcription-repair coupling factor (superfamily II helicase)
LPGATLRSRDDCAILGFRVCRWRRRGSPFLFIETLGETSLLNQDWLEQLEEVEYLEGLHDSSAGFIFSQLFQKTPGPFLWLCLNNRQAERLAESLRYFLPAKLSDSVLVLPGSEANPYRGLSPHPEISEKRAVGLWRLLEGFDGFCITTLHSAVARLISPQRFLSECVELEVGSFTPMSHLLTRLRELGYVREDPVTGLGEYSWRGGIVDVYSPSAEHPVRIEFFGDEVESIRAFDPGTQRSIALVPGCSIVPMREILVTARDVSDWHEKAPDYWNEVRFAQALQEKMEFTENLELFNGFEYLLPLVLETQHGLADYLDFSPKERPLRVVFQGPSDFWKEFLRLENAAQRDHLERQAGGELTLPPDRLFFSKAELEEWISRHKSYQLEELWTEPVQPHRFDFTSERKYQGRLQELLQDVVKWRAAGERVVLTMQSRGMAERVVDIFREYETTVPFEEGGFAEAVSHPLSVTHGKLSEGFHSPSLRLHVLSQDNVFEQTADKPSARQAGPQREVTATFLSDFRDLKEGDYVVHVEHGIGVFRGLKRIGVGDDVREFVELRYKDDAKLYVPIDRLGQIQKFSSAGESRPQVDRLGGVSWERTKSRIKKSMRDLAEDLLKLYARREMAQGHGFSSGDMLMKEFEDAFEFEETPDQAGAIRDVRSDMEAKRPMDRLVCGDVGYGKTEVAMRAAFKCVSDNKQVAVLAPTTVLAFQHYNTFRTRFQAFPVLIEMVSRFKTKQEQAEILQRTEQGTVDILIGTHRLLSKDVKFRDLGLLVIDEEQRFGVAQKERLKQLKTKVDVLTLSATPIPRTLNMSLIGLRDLSIIETPPKDRLSIQTVVVKFSRNIIRSAIDLELKRQGQAFFLHNSIDTIYSIANMVQETVPEARVAVAHGQMRERLLEEVMLDFLDYKYDVLVSTTIIENGLDIPRANTLIVNQADRFGLAQLYQLRGRVGRSSRRAYAFLLIASEETLTNDARKRLAAIKEFSDLGAGFRIAALDLEIRGTGNLLGGEQHGHINAVGLELYMKLLEETIRELKGEDVPPEILPALDLHCDIQIPEHYIADSNLRLWLYKRISSLRDRKNLEELKEETVDRFGKYPRSVSNLFEYAHLKLRAQQMRIISLDRKGNKIFLKFRDDTPVSPQRLMDMMGRGRSISFLPEGVVAVIIPSASPTQIFEELHTILDDLAVLE